MVESLGRKRTGAVAVRRLDERDSARRLNEAVEPCPLGILHAPSAELRDDQTRISAREHFRLQPQPVESSGTVAEYDGIGMREQLLQPRHARVQHRGSLAVSGVEVLPLRFGQMWGIDTQHVGTEHGERA